MAEIEKKPAYMKVTVDTPLYIDFDYWKSKEDHWRTLLSGYLCSEHLEAFNQAGEGTDMIDAVDPETGEVTQKDLLMDSLFDHCAKQEDFIPENSPLTDSIFRVFLSRNNQPMSSAELGEILNKSAATILKTLTSRNYRGIRPAN